MESTYSRERKIMAEQKKVSGQGSGDPKKDAENAKWEREKQAMTDRHQKDKEAFAKKKELASKSKKDKKENTFEFDPVKEASTKANKLHIMHAAKLISKMKSGHEKENAITDLEKKAKNLGLDRAEYEKILDKQGAYEETLHKTQEEAENMHNYINILSLDRSVNLWSEAARAKDEDLGPVNGKKTLTKKSQEKVTLNPMEKDSLKR